MTAEDMAAPKARSLVITGKKMSRTYWSKMGQKAISESCSVNLVRTVQIAKMLLR